MLFSVTIIIVVVIQCHYYYYYYADADYNYAGNLWIYVISHVVLTSQKVVSPIALLGKA